MFVINVEEETIMRYTRALDFSAVFIAVVLLGAGSVRSRAQEATPPPHRTGTSVIEVLGVASNPSLAPDYNLEVDRFYWLPGFAMAPHTHTDESDLFVILSGELGWTMQRGEAAITRAPLNGVPGAVEILKPGTEAVLRAGDSLAVDFATGAVHSARVIGDAPAVFLDAGIIDPEKAHTVFLDEMTPTP
jgi:mannose-6-phosphate isomerase-like protein (cupin superfamily)